MKDFVSLINAVGATSSTLKKKKAIVEYLKTASEADANWALYFPAGETLKRQIKTTSLRVWASELCGLPLTLIEESYHVVGDLAETISLLPFSPGSPSSTLPTTLREWVIFIQEMKDLSEEEKKNRVFSVWGNLSAEELFVFNKLLTGGLRIGVSKSLVIQAISTFTAIEESTVSLVLSGELKAGTNLLGLLRNEKIDGVVSLKPYPFYLSYPVEGEVSALGDNVSEWSAEWKWDGIRGQIVMRDGRLAVWSRGEELITESIPEFAPFIHLPYSSIVIDGEIIGWKDGAPLPFQLLQKRTTRKKITKSILEEIPIHFICYDILELNGEDLRPKPLSTRRELLEEFVSSALENLQLPLPIHTSPLLKFGSWEELGALQQSARSMLAEGVMIKRRDSVYRSGRRRGEWWKWKVEPYVVDAVLLYAQKGHGRRANLYTDYTFGVWSTVPAESSSSSSGEISSTPHLVTFAKAYSGLTDKEIGEVDAWIRRHTIERFGSVRSVKPELVFELAFEGIQLSSRHKSGVAVRFPRIKRIRRDKPAAEADSLETIKALLKQV